MTGTVVIDLKADSDPADRRATRALLGLPDGIRVILEVGDRTYPPAGIVDQLQQYADRVHYDVHGTLAAVDAWVRDLRAGSSWTRAG